MGKFFQVKRTDSISLGRDLALQECQKEEPLSGWQMILSCAKELSRAGSLLLKCCTFNLLL